MYNVTLWHVCCITTVSLETKQVPFVLSYICCSPQYKNLVLWRNKTMGSVCIVVHLQNIMFWC